MQSTFSKGVMFALCAAALNATIGVLSKVLMNDGCGFRSTVTGRFG
ncbi:hypothetical protein SAMN05216178_3654 [Pseudomonas saponiphila]|uniref:Uncharacterized protein n=1 Tax=Pseudomonas saponiphila TaxID=556534 RepID=A0A1H4Q836_9PSED|nr:hypothetical protein SAMN05216178_3654 [Pseudomonas saponiphila]